MIGSPSSKQTSTSQSSTATRITKLNGNISSVFGFKAIKKNLQEKKSQFLAPKVHNDNAFVALSLSR